MRAPRERPVQEGGKFAGKPYLKTQAEYAAMYGKPLVSIKRWWKQRKPLDDPDLMGEHFSPRGRKPESEEEFEAPSIVLPPIGCQEEEPADPVAIGEEFYKGKGVLAAIERLQLAEKDRSAAWLKAIVNKHAAIVVQNRFKEWIAIVEALRKLEKDAPEIRKLNELSLDKAEAEAAWGQVLSAFNAAANNFPGRAAGKLSGLTDYQEIYDVLEREISVLRRALVDSIEAMASEAEAAAVENQEAPGV